MRGHLRTALLLLATFGLLALFLRNASLADVTREIRGADLLLLLAGTFFTVVTYLVRAWRWQVLLAPIGRTHFSTAFRTTIIGFAANFLLPARVGEFLRPYLLARREHLDPTSAFATIVLERLVDLLTVLLFFGVFVVFFDDSLRSTEGATYQAVKTGGLSAAAAAILGAALFFVLAGHPERLARVVDRLVRVLPARVGGFITHLARTFATGLAVMRQPVHLVRALALSLPLWLSIATGIWLVTRAFHITMPFPGSFLLVALLTVGVAVPTPGSVGGFHYAYRVGATVFYGATNEQAVGAALVLHAISFIPVALLGVLFMVQDGLQLSGLKRLADEKDELEAQLDGTGPGGPVPREGSQR